MMRHFLILLILATFLVPASMMPVIAQEVPEVETIEKTVPADVRGRVDVDFDIPITDRLSFTVNNELRFRNNLSRIDRNYLLGSLGYEVCDYFSVSAGYIFMSFLTQGQVWYDAHWEYRHRVFSDLKGQIEYGNWKFSLTERPLVNIRAWGPDPDVLPKYEWIIRSKFKVDYEIPHTDLSPYFFTELSNTLNTGTYGGGAFIDRTRFSLGLKWDATDNFGMELYYYFDIRNSRKVDDTHGSDGSVYTVYLTKQTQYVHVLGLSFNFGW